MIAMSRAVVARTRALLLPGRAAALPYSSSSRPYFPNSSYAASGPYFPNSRHASAGAPFPSSSAASAGEAAKAAAGSGADREAPAPRRRWGRGLLKFGFFAALAGALGGTGYVSYAYTLKEVDEKTREFRKNMVGMMPPPVEENASELEKFQVMAHTTALKVPVAAIELYLDVRTKIEDHVIRGFAEPMSDKLLPDLHPLERNVYTLVLDLEGTLVCSDWQRETGWRTFKRPGVDAFVEHMSNYYEVVVYSDQMPAYVEPIVERLDRKKGYIRTGLSRPATKYQDGKHYRDLSKLNRDPARVLYISGHALESCLQPENCVTIRPWKLETEDKQLMDLIPFLQCIATYRPADVRAVLTTYQGCDIATEYDKRVKEHQRRQQRTGVFQR